MRHISCCQKFYQDSESVFRIFLGGRISQRQPLPPERLPLLLRVAHESSGGVTTQTLHTKILTFLVRNNASCPLNDFPTLYRQLKLILPLYFVCMWTNQLPYSKPHSYLNSRSVKTATGSYHIFCVFITTSFSYHSPSSWLSRAAKMVLWLGNQPRSLPCFYLEVSLNTILDQSELLNMRARCRTVFDVW